MTLVELTVTMVVLVVAISGTLGSISSFVVLSDGNWERSVAYTAAQETIERMQSESFSDVFARYNGDAADDPGPGAPGANFDVDGLDAQEGDPDGRVGRIELPVQAGAPTSLFENLADPDFGMPRDLNSDGVVDALDHAGDHDILPVRVVIEWRGHSGQRRVELSTVLRNG